MINIKFMLWFTLKLEVENYTGDVFDLCDLVPTDKCLHNLDAARLIVKKQPNMLTHLIEVNPTGPDTDKPLYPPVETLVFRYQLMDKAGLFNAKSNVQSLDPANYILYLSNNANNKSGSILYTNKSGTAAGTQDRVFKGTFGEVQDGALAAIDIFQNKLVSTDYRLQDVSGKCVEPVFTIRFSKHI